MRDLLDLADEDQATWVPTNQGHLKSTKPRPQPAEWELITIALPPTPEQLALFPSSWLPLKNAIPTPASRPATASRFRPSPHPSTSAPSACFPSPIHSSPLSPSQLSPAQTRRQGSPGQQEQSHDRSANLRRRRPSCNEERSTDYESIGLLADALDDGASGGKGHAAVSCLMEKLRRMLLDCRTATAKMAAEWGLTAAERARLVAGTVPSMAAIQAAITASGAAVAIEEVGEGLVLRRTDGVSKNLAIVESDALGRVGMTAEEALDHPYLRAGRRAAGRVRHWERRGDCCLERPLFTNELPRRWNLVAQVMRAGYS
jgi:hypothetical protein